MKLFFLIDSFCSLRECSCIVFGEWFCPLQWSACLVSRWAIRFFSSPMLPISMACVWVCQMVSIMILGWSSLYLWILSFWQYRIWQEWVLSTFCYHSLCCFFCPKYLAGFCCYFAPTSSLPHFLALIRNTLWLYKECSSSSFKMWHLPHLTLFSFPFVSFFWDEAYSLPLTIFTGCLNMCWNGRKAGNRSMYQRMKWRQSCIFIFYFFGRCIPVSTSFAVCSTVRGFHTLWSEMVVFWGD